MGTAVKKRLFLFCFVFQKKQLFSLLLQDFRLTNIWQSSIFMYKSASCHCDKNTRVNHLQEGRIYLSDGLDISVHGCLMLGHDELEHYGRETVMEQNFVS